LGNKGAKLEHTLKRLAQKTGVSKSSERTATQLLELSSEVGVWCALSARSTVGPVFFNETVNCEKYLRVERTEFSSPPANCEL
jgi:hypothetical protein